MGRPNKILVTGFSGSGKTTLARRIEEEFNLPAIHFDDFCFDKNHNIISDEEIKRIFSSSSLSTKWIFEGTYSVVIEEYINKADVLIYLDTNLFQNVNNLLKRKIRKISRLKDSKSANNIIRKQFRNFSSILVNRRDKKNKFNDIIKNKAGLSKIIKVKNINKRKIDKIIKEIGNIV